jgi:hypothetical protein
MTILILITSTTEIKIRKPGTILTFFPWNEQGFRGKRGTGQVGTISFSIPLSSLNYWIGTT